MRSHAKATTAGSTSTQANGLGRFCGALATRAAFAAVKKSGAPSFARQVLALLCALTAALTFTAAPALAVPTHLFQNTFGAGQSQGGLNPEGLAVDNSASISSGDIYVSGGAVINKYTPASAAAGTNTPDQQLSAEGLSYTDGLAVDPTNGNVFATDVFAAKVFEFGPDGTQIPFTVTGISFTGSVGGITVNPKDGHIFVADWGNNAIYELNPDGAYTGNSFIGPNIGRSLALDSHGNLYAAVGSSTAKFDTSSCSTLPTCLDYTTLDSNAEGVAVDLSNDDVYITEPHQISQFDEAGNPVGPPFGASVGLGGVKGVGIDKTSGEVYVADNPDNDAARFGPLVNLPTVTTEAVTGVQIGQVTLHGTVNPAGVPVTECNFEFVPQVQFEADQYASLTPAEKAGCLRDDNGETDLGSGTEAVPVHADLSGLTPGTTYHYRLSAANADGSNPSADQTFHTPGPAIIGAAAVSDLGSGEVTLSAPVNPNGLSTTYHFEYLTDAAFQANLQEGEDGFTGATRAPKAPAEDKGLGANEEPLSASARISGLAPGTLYHFRTLATNAGGTSSGVEATFQTYPAALGGLPDDRADEMVSPAQKNGGVAGAENNGSPLYAVASADGEAILYEAIGAFADAEAALDTHYVAHRSTAGWGNHAILPSPPGQSSPNLISGSTLRIEPSADFRSFLFAPFGTFTTEIPDHNTFAESVYIAGPDRSITWLARPTIAHPDPELGNAQATGRLNLAGASADLSADYFTYYGTLVPEDEQVGLGGKSRAEVLAEHGGANAFPFDHGFYEWRNGRLLNAGRLPDGSYDPAGAEPASTANDFVAPPADYHNQVSVDGSRAFFVSPNREMCEPPPGALKPECEGKRPQLYVRKDGLGSVLVSGNESGEPAPDGPLPMSTLNAHSRKSFMYASPDGSHVFFESRDPLSSDAPADAVSAKMYVFDTNTDQLTYLPDVGTSPEVPAATGASVLAVSNDGSRMLFARTKSSAIQVDLWVDGPNGGSVTPVASLTGAYVPVSRFAGGNDVVVFQTTGTIVEGGFNSGGKEQIYRYDAAAAKLACLSCPPAGIASSGDAHLSTDDVVAERKPLDSRGVSADGTRVFFDTPDPLVVRDKNSGKRDVYEWEAPGAGSCREGGPGFSPTAAGCVYLITSGTSSNNSYFLDNSESGGDVFFTTAAGIDPADTDGSYDVYDARVNGGFAKGAAPCSGEACQPLSEAPVAQSAGSASFSGPPNPAAKRKGKKHKHQAKRKHRKRANNHRRASR